MSTQSLGLLTVGAEACPRCGKTLARCLTPGGKVRLYAQTMSERGAGEPSSDLESRVERAMRRGTTSEGGKMQV